MSKKYALISVSDKTGIVEFAREVSQLGYGIISTGGTATALEKAGVKVVPISEVTGFPECLDGRVKTLHPIIHAGLLAKRDNAEHMEQLKKHNISQIDIVVVNLYPFRQTVSNPNVELEHAVENIDIGGPTMLRSAAKNYQDVCVLVDPNDYGTVLAQLKEKGKVDKNTKFYLMYKVFEHTASYDSMIFNFLRSKQGIDTPDALTVSYEKAQGLRYGENPHQFAAFYKDLFAKRGTLSQAEQLHGKELSYNNINDTSAALNLLKEFDTTAAVALKHANPCGVGCGKTVLEAFTRARDADPVSIFGGIVAINGVVDKATAELINGIFIEIVIAEGFDDEALAILTKKKNIRLLKLEGIKEKQHRQEAEIKSVSGGLLMQNIDTEIFNEDDLKVVTKVQPTKSQLEDLKFAYKVVKHTKSNAIVLAKDFATTGIGMGQTNRIWATNQAIEHAAEKAGGSVMASDAFFPFADCVLAAAKAGITAIIQPGGSINDKESIEMCDKHGIAMVLCGMRHFKH